MKHKLVMSRSSYLTTIPVLVGLFVLGVLSAVWEWSGLSRILLFVALFSLLCRLWANMALSKLRVQFQTEGKGVFPGEKLQTTILLQNSKLLPVLWIELFFPLTKNHCLIPEHTRQPEEWEKPALLQTGVSDILVGSYRIPGLLWNENRRETISWTASKRGIYSANLWRIRTGDGFGLAQVDTPAECKDHFAVFPALKEVDPSFFLRNLWNSEFGPKGVMEDLTVIRSTRAYTPSDPSKRINWRLKARGLPLQVNVYEDTLPKGVHFILDGESFSGPEAHLDELEETLSILSSLAVELENHQIYCGLTLPIGKTNAPLSVLPEEGTDALLWALAGYDPCESRKDDGGNVIRQHSQFEESRLLSNVNSVGRYYYVVYDMSEVPSLLLKLESSNVSVLTWKDVGTDSAFETVCLRGFLSGGAV